MKKLIFLLIAIMLWSYTDAILAQKILAKNSVSFNRPNGKYTSDMLSNDFGNGHYPENRDFAEIKDNVYKITFKKGMKVENTGASAQLKIKPALQYTLQYRIKYDDKFENGLHGKQFGFIIGANYTGGRADEARNNGDGGSVRLQFDAKGDSISNQLYVYYSEMTGKYGNNPGNHKFSMARGEWNIIKLTVTMQSDVNKSDGRIEVWCNAAKKIDVQNMRFVRVEKGRKITKLAFESFPGGGGIIPTYDNYLYVDDFEWNQGNCI